MIVWKWKKRRLLFSHIQWGFCCCWLLFASSYSRSLFFTFYFRLLLLLLYFFVFIQIVCVEFMALPLFRVALKINRLSIYVYVSVLYAIRVYMRWEWEHWFRMKFKWKTTTPTKVYAMDALLRFASFLLFFFSLLYTHRVKETFVTVVGVVACCRRFISHSSFCVYYGAKAYILLLAVFLCR